MNALAIILSLVAIGIALLVFGVIYMVQDGKPDSDPNFERKASSEAFEIVVKIKRDDELFLEYRKLRSRTRSELLLNVPSTEELRGTIFEGYYSYFYKTDANLAILNMVARHSDKLSSPFSEELIERYSWRDKRSEAVLTKFPWLIATHDNHEDKNTTIDDQGEPGDVTL